ncbi:hypothetical protein [Streptomyces sp. NPDC008125]|uniref:hypothetical protein n=1 Tax=Streptomyces sp. NPDC008125 TaxID=3364811 RepID=UPI0036ED5D20
MPSVPGRPVPGLRRRCLLGPIAWEPTGILGFRDRKQRRRRTHRPAPYVSRPVEPAPGAAQARAVAGDVEANTATAAAVV